MPLHGVSQIDLGKYLYCFDMYWKCHTYYNLTLSDSNGFEITLGDDVRKETSYGTWTIENGYLELNPDVIPDTIDYSFNQRRITKSSKARLKEKTGQNLRRKHCISVTIDYEPVIGSEIKVFSDKLLNLQTDSLGYVYFKGSIPDSIGVDVLGRNFMFYPTENKEKYLYQIWYYTDHKDVVFRLIRNGRIPIERDEICI